MQPKHMLTLVALAGTIASHAGAQVISASFEFIVDDQTGYRAASANDLTPDGRWVLGMMDTDGDGLGDIAYRWDRLNDVFDYIETGTIATGQDTVQAISDDGQIILGDIPGGIDGNTSEAGFWTAELGWTSIGYLPNAGQCPSRSSAYELSADGSVAVGLSWDGCSGRAFRWTEETGMQELENLANGGNRASVVSGDGSVIAGFAQGFTRTPAYWDGNTMQGTLVDPTYLAVGEFQGISDDGSILLGSWSMGNDTYAKAATLIGGQTTVIGAGSLLPGWAGVPMDIADNGTIVGFDFLLGNRRSWIQPYGTGDLQETVSYINSLGADIDPALSLEVLQAISTDGHAIIGHGIAGAWLITLEYACTADFTGDGYLDIFDVFAFLDAFNSKNVAADFTGDGTLDIFDVFAYLDLFNAGCP